MAICNFDMQFTFACAWWEDTVHDSRVFLLALRDLQTNFPKPPNGKYYLIDAGYSQMKEMKVNTQEEDGPGRREMEILRNSIAQSLMSACT
ncbi:hypothetical protein Dsin_026684 [Dipteronia sinensis]|uniref:DDE Tnp4 domain-containing protein n=1 Tax=Dipteronia sinensis TaxID=43782 RepID=A0AAD9ZZ55_9ROSI|nr:hypothetical protein Dsin_026684 [Dipteronia sinensis]